MEWNVARKHYFGTAMESSRMQTDGSHNYREPGTEQLKIHGVDIRGFACGIGPIWQDARREARVVKMTHRGEYELKIWRWKSARILAKLFASGAERGQKSRSAPPMLWRTRFRYSTDLATLFDLKFPAHLAAACVHRFNVPTCKEIFSPPDATRRIRKHSQPLVPLGETTNRRERIERFRQHSGTLRGNKRTKFSFPTRKFLLAKRGNFLWNLWRCYVATFKSCFQVLFLSFSLSREYCICTIVL